MRRPDRSQDLHSDSGPCEELPPQGSDAFGVDIQRPIRRLRFGDHEEGWMVPLGLTTRYTRN